MPRGSGVLDIMIFLCKASRLDLLRLCVKKSFTDQYAAKDKQKDMVKDVISNVDSDGSTLLHLAVDSGSSEVSILPRNFQLFQLLLFIFSFLLVLCFSLFQ